MKHKLDLYKAYKKSTHQKRAFDSNLTILIIPVLTLSLVIVGFSYQRNQLASVKSQVQKNQMLLDDEMFKTEFEEATELQEKLELQKIYLEQVNNINDVLTEKKKIYSYVLNAVEAALPPHVAVKTVIVDKYTVTINFESTTPTGPALLARNLRRNSSFNNVVYEGMKQEEAKTTEEILENGSTTITYDGARFKGSITLNLVGGF